MNVSSMGVKTLANKINPHFLLSGALCLEQVQSPDYESFIASNVPNSVFLMPAVELELASTLNGLKTNYSCMVHGLEAGPLKAVSSIIALTLVQFSSCPEECLSAILCCICP